MARNAFVPRYTGSVAFYCLKSDFQVYQTFKLNAWLLARGHILFHILLLPEGITDTCRMHQNKSSKVKVVFKLWGERKSSSGVCDLSLARWERGASLLRYSTFFTPASHINTVCIELFRITHNRSYSFGKFKYLRTFALLGCYLA